MNRGASGGGLTDALGATGAEKALNKITTVIAVGFIILAMILSYWGSRTGTGGSASSIFDDTPQQQTAPADFDLGSAGNFHRPGYLKTEGIFPGVIGRKYHRP